MLSCGWIFSWLPARRVEQDCSGLPFRDFGTLVVLARIRLPGFCVNQALTAGSPARAA